MSDELNPETIVDPAADVPVAPPAPPAPLEPEAPQPRMIPADVLVREITPLRGQLRQTEGELAEARRRLNEQNALLERLQRDPNATEPPARREQPAASDPGDIDRRAAELVFARDAQSISETAFRTYGNDWVQSVNILNSLGLNSGDFVGSVMEVVGRDKTHEIMHTLAQEPEKAASLAQMSPAKRIAEIARMSHAMSGSTATAAPAAPAKPAAARTVSRAPDPAPSIQAGGGAKQVPKYDDSLSDEEFTAQFNERLRQSAARR
jgi:hypothetical protein